MRIKSLAQLVPLHIATVDCDSHTHMLIGVTSDQPPSAGQNAFYSEAEGQYFYVFDEYIQCNS